MKQFLLKHQLLFALSVLNFLLVYAASFNTQYGYFIDEFYYIACAKRPAFGYVDHPPFAPLLLTIVQFLFDSSILVIRIIPALVSSATVFLTGKLTEELGGSVRARLIAALTMVCMPVAVAFAGFYSMNVFEPLLALIMLLLAVRLVKDGDTKTWFYIGITAGIGIMNKHTFVIAAFSLVLALLLNRQFNLIRSRYFVYGMLIAFLIVLPNIIWQILNNFPSLEFYQNITTRKNVYTPPLQFVIGQVINMSPINALVWVSGTMYLLIAKRMRPYRFLAVFFIINFLFLLISGTSRADRTLFAYAAVIAGGGVAIDVFYYRLKFRIIPAVLPTLQIGLLLIILPLILPYFPYNYVADRVVQLGINTEIEIGKKPLLPQLLADRIGWEAKAKMMTDEFNKLTEAEKSKTLVVAGNYGQAGALELYGESAGIKQVFCGHNNFYLWGKGKLFGETVLAIDDTLSENDYREVFDSVTVSKSMYWNGFVSMHENNLVIYTCRKPLYELNQLFDRSRVYN